MVQQTLAQPFSFEGVGIHTGVMARVTVYPASEYAGRFFQLGDMMLPASVEYVVDTRRCTTLGNETARIHTVEHLLSALHGLQIDNARIVVEGPEIPILDGSALPIVRLIDEAGVQSQSAPPRMMTLQAPAVWTEQDATIEVSPADKFSAEVTVEFNDWPEGKATVGVAIRVGDEAEYAAKVAPARTFAFRWEVEALLAAGLARGGSLDNALIITPPGIFSTPLRLPHEWAAHKLLDLIGDFALLNARLLLHVTARRPGHRVNALVASAVQRSQPA